MVHLHCDHLKNCIGKEKFDFHSLDCLEHQFMASNDIQFKNIETCKLDTF